MEARFLKAAAKEDGEGGVEAATAGTVVPPATTAEPPFGPFWPPPPGGVAAEAAKLLLVLALLPVLPKGGVKRLEGVPVAATEGSSDGAAVAGLALGVKPAKNNKLFLPPRFEFSRAMLR